MYVLCTVFPFCSPHDTNTPAIYLTPPLGLFVIQLPLWEWEWMLIIRAMNPIYWCMYHLPSPIAPIPLSIFHHSHWPYLYIYILSQPKRPARAQPWGNKPQRQTDSISLLFSTSSNKTQIIPLALLMVDPVLAPIHLLYYTKHWNGWRWEMVNRICMH